MISLWVLGGVKFDLNCLASQLFALKLWFLLIDFFWKEIVYAWMANIYILAVLLQVYNCDCISLLKFEFLKYQGHLIKNPSTQRAKSLHEIPCAHRIIISGTPLQNNLKVFILLLFFNVYHAMMSVEIIEAS